VEAIMRRILLVACLVLPVIGAGANAADTLRVAISTVDTLGVPIPTRVQVIDSFGATQPGEPNDSLLSHGSLGGYFYSPGLVGLDVPQGMTLITAGRGFEWSASQTAVDVQRDTLITVVLTKPFDMRSRGWICGDTHAHTAHWPSDYTIAPADAHLIARAEDLAIMWCLDQELEFTGGPHEVSDDEAVLYYSTEWRNQAYGHVSLLGLKEDMGTGCCQAPHPAVPTLSDLHDDWAPVAGEGIVLSHPHSTDDFFGDDGWPAWGLGRELPVLAASGRLGALDLLAYTNVPDIHVVDWYGLLNTGLNVPISAGTDAIMNMYWSRPPGGYRVYVKTSGALDVTEWVEALKGCRSFVSNYPLIPEFSVNGFFAGDTLIAAGPQIDLDVAFRVECTLPLNWAGIVVNGAVAESFPLEDVGDGTIADVMAAVQITQSAWIAVKVWGTTDHPHAVNPTLLAHSAPVYVHLDSMPVSRTLDAGRMLDWIADLETFVENRGNWDSDEDRTRVLGQFDEGALHYRSLFVIPPGAFELIQPAAGDSADVGGWVFFDWSAASDPESGDHVTYHLSISPDSAFTPGMQGALEYLLDESEKRVWGVLFEPGEIYWWRVLAKDRGGNQVSSTPDNCWFRLYGTPSVADGPESSKELRLAVWPNPASGSLLFRVDGEPSGPLRVEVFDVHGRRLAESSRPGDRGAAIRWSGADTFVWNGRDGQGRPAPSGRYWVTVSTEDGRSGGYVDRRVIASATLIR